MGFDDNGGVPQTRGEFFIYACEHVPQQYVRRNMAVLEEPLKKAVTRPLEQMFTLRELDEHVRLMTV